MKKGDPCFEKFPETVVNTGTLVGPGCQQVADVKWHPFPTRVVFILMVEPSKIMFFI